MSIGRNITRYRVDAGLSQRELAELLGKTPSAVSQYESNTIMPRMQTIERMAEIFHVSTADIVGNQEKLTAYEKQLLEVARTINKNGQRELMIYARGLAATYPHCDGEIQTA